CAGVASGQRPGRLDDAMRSAAPRFTGTAPLASDHSRRARAVSQGRIRSVEQAGAAHGAVHARHLSASSISIVTKDEIMNNNPMERSMAEVDPAIAQAIENEERRQHEGLELIASENFVSEAVLEAAGSVFTNKYAEGYPGKRYYGGCENVDRVETLAIERAKKLFGAEHANVQAHSGTQANVSVYMSVLEPGAVVLGMNLAHGGHLTHGHPLNFSGKMYKFVAYGVTKETELIDYDEIDRLAREHQPKM